MVDAISRYPSLKSDFHGSDIRPSTAFPCSFVFEIPPPRTDSRRPINGICEGEAVVERARRLVQYLFSEEWWNADTVQVDVHKA
jgi:hypothetical protein